MNKFKKAKQLIWASYAAMAVFTVLGWTMNQSVEPYAVGMFLFVVLDAVVDCVNPSKNKT